MPHKTGSPSSGRSAEETAQTSGVGIAERLRFRWNGAQPPGIVSVIEMNGLIWINIQPVDPTGLRIRVEELEEENQILQEKLDAIWEIAKPLADGVPTPDAHAASQEPNDRAKGYQS